MKKIINKFKLYFLIFTIFIILIFFALKNQAFKSSIYNNIWKKLSEKNQFIVKLIFQKEFRENFEFRKYHNDYNEKFLPFTQFEKLNIKKKKLSFLSNIQKNTSYFQGKDKLSSFNIELVFKDKILIIDNNNNLFFLLELKNLLNSNKDFGEILISSNLKSLNSFKILDALVKDNQIYVSYINKNKECQNYNIAKASLNKSFFDFQKIFSSKECGSFLQGGRLQFYNFNNLDYLLLTTGNNVWNKPDYSSQNQKSIFGKILKINPSNGNYDIFSSGHRNPQGLLVEKNLILETEHGPYGGDEINKIVFGGNYGWPIASEGDGYDFYSKNQEEPLYMKNHKNFIPPIYSFVPSIGISEIIKLPNNFSPFWQDNYLIASLNKKSLFRTRFNSNYDKLFFLEEIYIGERIRDLKFHENLGILFLALENKSQIGIISNNNVD